MTLSHVATNVLTDNAEHKTLVQTRGQCAVCLAICMHATVPEAANKFLERKECNHCTSIGTNFVVGVGYLP